EVPAGLSRLVMRLLAKRPAERPASAREVADALWELEEEVEATTDTTATTRSGRRKGAAARPAWWNAGRRPWLALAVGGALAAALLAGVVLFWETPGGTVRLETDDPDVEIVFDRTGPTIKGAEKEPIVLRAGEHGVLVKRGDFSFETDKLV